MNHFSPVSIRGCPPVAVLAAVLLLSGGLHLSAEGSYEYGDDAATAYPDLFPSANPDLLSEYWNLIQKGLLPNLAGTPSDPSGTAGTQQPQPKNNGTADANGPKSAAKPVTVPTAPGAPAAPAVSGPAAPVSAATDLPTRELSVRKGDEVSITLEGEGWVFLGEKQGKTGLSFKKRELSPAKADFYFQAKESGMYLLAFQKQLLTTGGSVRETVSVRVSEPSPAAPGGAVASAPAGNTGSLPQPQVPAAPLAPETPAGAPAGTSAGIPPAEAAAGGFQLVAALPMSPFEEADLLLKNRDPAGAVRVLEQFLEANPETAAADQYCFRLAQLYEKDPDVRNLKRSVSLYRRILDQYPFSTFYGTAEDRLEYINRHFFEIR